MSSCVIYVYYESSGAKRNLEFFNKYGLYETNNVTYLLVINGEKCSVNLSERWSIIKHRVNEGYDFAAWKEGLSFVDIDKYKYFIFMNDTVCGPFVDRHWIRTFTEMLNSEVKLAGISINCHTELYSKYHNRKSVPHVQSMFWCTDRIGLEIVQEKIFSLENMDKEKTVIYKELGLSLAILNAGYNITCILPKYQVDYRLPENQFINSQNGAYGDPQYPGAYFGRSLHPLETIFAKANRHVNDQVIENLIKIQSEMKFY